MSKIKDGVIGHAIGDAMGVPLEFSVREKLLEHPITSMIGYGSHDVPCGTLSDDTSMEIATMDSIINKNGLLDYNDIMMNFYYWLKDSKYTPHNEVFDAGRTCIQAIINFSKGYDVFECGLKDINANGNGSLMRILPIAYYCYYKKIENDEIYEIVKKISSLTHAHEISILGCYIYINYVLFLLKGNDKFKSYDMIKLIDYSKFSEESLNLYFRILKDDIKRFNIKEIKSSGYVVDTLEASMWVLLNARNYKEAIIGAINLGQDTDTIGAITGSMAGIVYGYNDIPREWLDKLVKKEYLEDLCDKLEKVLGRVIR